MLDLWTTTVWKGFSRVITSTTAARISHSEIIQYLPIQTRRGREAQHIFPEHTDVGVSPSLTVELLEKPPNPAQWPSLSLGEYCFGMRWYVGKAHWIPCWFTNAKPAQQSNENIICPANVWKECSDLSAERKENHSTKSVTVEQKCLTHVRQSCPATQKYLRVEAAQSVDCCNDPQRLHCFSSAGRKSHLQMGSVAGQRFHSKIRQQQVLNEYRDSATLGTNNSWLSVRPLKNYWIHWREIFDRNSWFSEGYSNRL